MKALLFFCVFTIAGVYTYAQSGISLDVSAPSSVNGYGAVRFNNATAQNAKLGDIDPGDITGSPNFNDNWNMGIVVLINDKPVKISRVKMNLFNNELHYIDSVGVEMVVDDANVKTVYLMDAKDTAKVAALFYVIQGYQGKPGGTYMQALNQGGTELLKYNEVKVVKRDYDALSGKTSYRFQPNISYLFFKAGAVTPLKNFNKAEIFTVLLPGADASTWLNNNKNNLKTEKDVVSFLAYYNKAGGQAQ